MNVEYLRTSNKNGTWENLYVLKMKDVDYILDEVGVYCLQASIKDSLALGQIRKKIRTQRGE